MTIIGNDVDAVVWHGRLAVSPNDVSSYHILEPKSVGYPTQFQIRPLQFSNPALRG
jgi:hypothetical protein